MKIMGGLKKFAQKILGVFTDRETAARIQNNVQTLQNTAASLSARIDSIAGGATDTEILDARVDHRGYSHATLGEKWYKDGTVSVMNGSNIVTGTKTAWKDAGLKKGERPYALVY